MKKTTLFVIIMSFVVGGIVALITVPVLMTSRSEEGAIFFTCEQYPLFPSDFTDWEQKKIIETAQTDIRLFQSPFEGGLVKEVLTTSVKIDEDTSLWHLIIYQYTVNEEICFSIPPAPQVQRGTPQVQLRGNKSI